jgi:hypothetical protein
MILSADWWNGVHDKLLDGRKNNPDKGLVYKESEIDQTALGMSMRAIGMCVPSS